jgi:hypothetical protein
MNRSLVVAVKNDLLRGRWLSTGYKKPRLDVLIRAVRLFFDDITHLYLNIFGWHTSKVEVVRRLVAELCEGSHASDQVDL